MTEKNIYLYKMSLLNLVQGQRVYTQQIQHDLSTSNVMVNCDPRLKGPEGSVLDVKSRAGKIGVEDDICDLTVNNLTVKGTLTAKFDGSNLEGGTNYSDYLFYDNASKCFAVGGDQVHLGTNALAAQNTPNLLPSQAVDTIAIGNGAIANATGVFSGNKNVGGVIAIGKNAMNDITGIGGAVHNDVIAIGTNAMENLAGQTNTGNIAIGSGAMRNNPAANFHPREGCIAIGKDAMSVFTNAGAGTTQNVAIGNEAFKTPGNVTNEGGNVVAVGFQAASENCEDDSVAIGSLAGKENLNFRSVVIGFEAAEEGNDNGGNTVAIGYAASKAGAGSNSVAIGARANENNQLGAASIAIGEEAAGGAATRKDNTIVINATGTDLNSVGNNALHIATSALAGTQGNPGGLIEQPSGGGAVTAPTSADFQHYLVYNSQTGEIKACKI